MTGIKLWREWVGSSMNRTGNMLPMEIFDNVLEMYDPGYWSHYAFLEQDALEIREAGHSRGFSQYVVANDHLLIDLDDGDTSVEHVEEVLKSRGIGYEVWFSGSKGYHIKVKHDLIVNRHLPYSHLKWVESLGIDFDRNLYQHGRVVSLPGRIHPKTKKRKTLVRKVEGDKAVIPIFEPSNISYSFKPDGGLSKIQSGLRRFSDLAVKCPDLGSRHTALWGASKDLAEAGFDFETVLSLALRVNETWDQSKSPEEVKAAVEQAFRQANTETY